MVVYTVVKCRILLRKTGAKFEDAHIYKKIFVLNVFYFIGIISKPVLVNTVSGFYPKSVWLWFSLLRCGFVFLSDKCKLVQ